MRNIKKKIIPFIFFGIILSSNLNLKIPKITSNSNSRNNLDLILGIMVEFQQENPDDAATSGDGTFLNELDVGYINYNDILRCDPDNHFLLDPPPHNRDYFYSQMVFL